MRPIHVEPTPVVKLKSDEDPRWDGYFNGGTDFGMINWDAKNGKHYDHFWHCGYGAAFQDRYIINGNYYILIQFIFFQKKIIT